MSGQQRDGAVPAEMVQDRSLHSLIASLHDGGAETSAETVARAVAAHASEAVEDAICLIGLPTCRPGLFQVVGHGAEAVEQELAGSLAGQALRERRPLEVTADASPPVRVVGDAEAASARVVPLLEDGVDGGALGVVGFLRDSGPAFTSDEREIIDGYAGLARLELQRALLDRLAAESARLSRLALAVASDLAEASTPEEVVHRLLNRVVEVVTARRGVLCTVQRDSLTVEAAGGNDGAVEWVRRAYPLSDFPVAANTITTQETLHVHGRSGDLLPPPLSAALREGEHGVLLPLSFGNQVTAVLMVCRPDRSFAPADVDLLLLVGSVAVVALRHLHLLAEAANAVSAKNSYLNLAAHELRTPLTVVRGYLSLLAEGSFGEAPDEWSPVLRTVLMKTDELGGIVEDLLTAARIDGGGMTPRREVLDVRNSIAHAVGRAAGRAGLLGATIATDEPDHPVLVRVDPNHLARILDNLVNNALSYSTGSPWVSIELSVAEDRIEVGVSDHGVGVEPEHRDAIFERFQRVEGPAVPRRPGTGLGLPIARDLAERNGGSLVLAESVRGAGSRFVIALESAAL